MGNFKNRARKNMRNANNWRQIIKGRKPKTKNKQDEDLNELESSRNEVLNLLSNKDENLNSCIDGNNPTLLESVSDCQERELGSCKLNCFEERGRVNLKRKLKNLEEDTNIKRGRRSGLRDIKSVDPPNESHSEGHINEMKVRKEMLLGRGMLNLGNSCFFNACMQTFFHIPAVNRLFQNKRKRKCDCLFCNIIIAFKKTHTQIERGPYNPSNLYNRFKLTSPDLLNGLQQDALEFWIRIMDNIETKSNCSVKLNKLFAHGIITNTICGNCQNNSQIEYKTSGHVVQISGRQNIQEVVHAYFSSESLEAYRCDVCKIVTQQSTIKSHSLSSAPECLVIVLNRFENEDKKNEDDMILSNNLNLSQYFAKKNIKQLNYKLVSIINHFGSRPSNGHYTAISCHANNLFTEFDDGFVRGLKSVNGRNAYILIYELNTVMNEHSTIISSTNDSCNSDNINGTSKTTDRNQSTFEPSCTHMNQSSNVPQEVTTNNTRASQNEISHTSLQNENYDPFSKTQDSISDPTIETDDCSTTQNSEKEILTGRRIVDVRFFVQQVRNLDKQPEDCDLHEMEFTKEIKLGLRSIFVYKCFNCGLTRKIESCVNNEEWISESVNVNEAAVLGITSIGLGFYHLDELCAHLGIPCMSSSTFTLEDKKLQKIWWELAQKETLKALQDEIQLAIAINSIDSKGNALIPVVVDGSWAKRSYGKGSNSLSGFACIIGMRTKKVLYFDVKNKYCHICKLSYGKTCPPNKHECNINYEGPSTGMEAEIIVEGFQACERLGARFDKFVGDGDSSTFKELRELTLYKDPELNIEKYELSTATKFQVALRKYITLHKGDEICKGVRMASRYWRSSDLDNVEKLENLEIDCLNSPYHYFGIHEECKEYFCDKITTPESRETIDLLKSDGLFYEILDYINIYFASNAKSLLAGFNNNAAEELNSHIAKTTAGKRLNFIMSGSYKGRCAMSVVHFNTEGHSGSTIQKYRNKSSGKLCLKIENARKQKCSRNAAARLLKPRKKVFKEAKSGNFYGPECGKPDMEDRMFDVAKAVELTRLNENRINREVILKETYGQKHNPKWFDIRKKMVNCSYFHRIINAKTKNSYSKLVQEMLYSLTEFRNTAEVRHQRMYELDALNCFSKKYKDHQLEKTGIFIDKEISYLGASPSRIYGSDSIVVVKCPKKAYKKTVDEAIKLNLLPYWKKEKNGIISKKTKSSWNIEIQGLLHVTDKKLAFLVVWLGENQVKIEKVERDDKFWAEEMEEKLCFFYNEAMVKEVVNPRRRRKMDMRKYDPASDSFI